MWGPLPLICIVFASVLAKETGPLNNRQPGWIPGVKYIYGVQSRSLTSQNEVENQYVGVITEAILELQLDKKDSEQLNAKVRNAKYAEVHTRLSDGWDAAINNLSSWKQLHLAYPTFAVTIKNGQIKKIIVNKNTSTYEANIYRAMMSPLTLNSGESTMIKTGSLNNEPSCGPRGKNNGFYSVLEETLVGKCQTQYDVSQLPIWVLQAQAQLAPSINLKPQLQTQSFLDIVKTTNFSRCSRHALYHQGLGPRGHKDSGDSAVGHAFAHSSTTRQIVEGTLNSYVVHSAVTTNQFEASLLLYNQKRAKITSRMNVTLMSITSHEMDSIPLPGNAQKRSLQFQIIPTTFQGLDVDDVHTSDTRAKVPRNYFEPRITTNSEYMLSRELEWQMETRRLPSGNKRNLKKTGRAANSRTKTICKNDKKSDSSDSDICNSNNSILDDSNSEEDGPLEKPGLQFPSVNPHFPIYNQENNLHLVENIVNVCKMIGEDLGGLNNVIDNYTLAKFTLLVRLVRNATFDQLQMATEALYTPEKKSAFDSHRLAWEALRDASAQAGTGPALMALRGWVREQRLSAAEAASFIAALPLAARLPSSSYMAFFFEHFVHDAEVRNLPPLYSASLLAFTDLLRQAYVEGRLANARYPVHTYRGLALGSKLPPRFYVGYLARRLQRAVVRGSSKDAQLLIRALGNVGDRSVAQALAPFLRGAAPGAPPGTGRVTVFQRVAMVAALGPLAAAQPDAARELAFTVFLNEAEAYEVRVAAVFVLMSAQPPADMLQRLAQSTHWERSPHVVSAVRSAIQSAAALSDPRCKQMAKDARAALGLLNNQPLSAHYSHSYTKDYFIHGTRNMGYSFINNYIGSDDHIIPKALYMGISRYLGGMDLKKERMSAMVSSVRQLLGVLRGSDAPSGEAASQDAEPRAREPLEAQLRFPVPGADAFLPLDQQDFERLQYELLGMILALEDGSALNYGKMYSGARMSLALPDAAGNLVYYAYRTPTLLSLRAEGEGYVQADITGVQQVQVEGSTHLRYATMQSGHLGFVNNYSQKPIRYLTALEREAMLNLPLRINFTYNQEQQESINLPGVTISLETLQLSKGAIEVARMRVEPYTTIQAVDDTQPPALSKEKKIIDVRPPTKVTHDMGAVVVDVLTQGEQPRGGEGMGGARAWAQEPASSALALLAFPLACTHDLHADQRLSVRPDILQKITLNARYRAMNTQNEWSFENSQYLRPESKKNEQNHTFSQTEDYQSQTLDLGIKFQSPVVTGIAKASMNYTRCSSRNTDFFRLHYNFSVASRNEMWSRVIQQLDVEADGKWAHVPVFDTEEAFKKSPDSSITGKLIYSSGFRANEPVMGITAKCQLWRSEGRLRLLRDGALAAQCRLRTAQGQRLHPACLAAARRAGALDALRCDARLQHPRPAFLNASFAAVEALRDFWAPHATLGPGHGRQGHAAMQMQMSESGKALSASVHGPSMTWEVDNMPLGWLGAEEIAAHPSYNLPQRLAHSLLLGREQSMCILDQHTITTLDNNAFTLNPREFEDCWMVLMTSSPFAASPEKNVTVLARNEDRGGHGWAVRILVGDDITITMAPPHNNLGHLDYSFLISSSSDVDSQSTRFNLSRTDSKVVPSKSIFTVAGPVKLTVAEDKFNSVELPDQGIVVFSDGSGVVIHVNQGLSGVVNGLCGKFEEISSISKVSKVIWNPEECKPMLVDQFRSKRFPDNSPFYPPIRSNVHHNSTSGKGEYYKTFSYNTDSPSDGISTSDINSDNSLLYEYNNSTSKSSDSSSSLEKN